MRMAVQARTERNAALQAFSWIGPMQFAPAVAHRGVPMPEMDMALLHVG
jgi:hypothetical protein